MGLTDTVSVIVAAHPGRLANAPGHPYSYLDAALKSVWSQTRHPDAVHIAIDTGKDGAPVTRGRALQAASTDWVAFLDSDDLFKPRHLELCLKHALETGADVVYPWFTILQSFPNGSDRMLEWNTAHGDGVFPPGHYLNEFDPADPIETTITLFVRTELAQKVSMRSLEAERDGANTGEDRAFIQDCLAAGATIRHLKRFTWYWRHHWLAQDVKGNTSGMPSRGDATLAV